MYFGYTYKECQEQELNLGLDLKGGMNVTLEVSVGDILKILANKSSDATLIRLLIEQIKNKEILKMTLLMISFLLLMKSMKRIKLMFYCRHLVFLVIDIC